MKAAKLFFDNQFIVDWNNVKSIDKFIYQNSRDIEEDYEEDLLYFI